MLAVTFCSCASALDQASLGLLNVAVGAGIAASVNKLYELAVHEKDYAAQALMQWFATEQVEEEKTARQILEEVKKIGENSTAIFFQDRHLGKAAGK